MQERPDAASLLEAVASFLKQDLAPVLEDRGLAFRAQIAASLTTLVASELRSSDARRRSELERLSALMPDLAQAADEDAKAQLRRLNAALVERLRAGAMSPEQLTAVMAHLRATLIETLAVTSPRFDPRATPE